MQSPFSARSKPRHRATLATRRWSRWSPPQPARCSPEPAAERCLPRPPSPSRCPPSPPTAEPVEPVEDKNEDESEDRSEDESEDEDESEASKAQDESEDVAVFCFEAQSNGVRLTLAVFARDVPAHSK